MKTAQVKSWLVFGGSVIISLFFIWFGFKLFTLANKEVSEVQLFLLGSACVLASVFVMSNVKKYNLPAAAVLLGVGIYYFARAAEIISSPILVQLLGLTSWGAAALLLYMTYPKEHTAPAPGIEENNKK